MTQIYGNQWLREFGNKPNEMWSDSLNKLTSEEVKRGLTKCIESKSPYAPTLPLFVGWCKDDDGSTPEQKIQQQKAIESQKLLTKSRNESSDDVKRAAIAQMKKMLAGA
jgi:hypothetical protein